MLQFEELRLELLNEKRPWRIWATRWTSRIKKEIAELEAEAAQEGFWDDLDNSQKVLQKTSRLKDKVGMYEKLCADFDDALMMIELSNEEEDLELLPECRASVTDIQDRIKSETLVTLLSGEYDANNAILTFHAGAGGTEAQDWVSMLYRMYNRWAERHGFKATTIDFWMEKRPALNPPSC